MRNLLKAILISVIITTPVMASDAKIGVVDMEKAVMSTTKAKNMSEQFVKDFSADQEKAKKIDADLKALNEKVKKSGAAPSKADQDAFKSKSQERNDIVKRIKQAEQDRLQELRAAVDPKIKDVMKAVADKGGYSIIVDRKAVPYYKDSDDVTQQTTEKLNQVLK